MDTEGGGPTPPSDELTPDERQRVARWAGTTVGIVFGVLVTLAANGVVGVVDVVVGTVLYGGLLGLTVGVVGHEVVSARRCPRCGDTASARRSVCEECGYDLQARPVWSCELRHERHHEPGLCSCGRRLLEGPPVPGLGRSLRRSLWTGLWLLVFLVGTSVLLQLTS